jgi:Xaa-Pro aminopeptidase
MTPEARRQCDTAVMDEVAQSLLAAQHQAEALFAAVVADGLIRPGRLESELTEDIRALAQQRFAMRRHWHKRVVRAGPNTLLTYHDEPRDRRIAEDDIVYLDFGPLFESWEADFGRTYALGSDPVKHRLIADLAEAFERGKRLYQDLETLTAGQLYDFVVAEAAQYGWEFGAPTAGHLIGRFPHEHAPDSKRFSIRHGNTLALREPDDAGRPRHWILEIHFIDRQRQIGGFYEQLLTVESPPAA